MTMKELLVLYPPPKTMVELDRDYEQVFGELKQGDILFSLDNQKIISTEVVFGFEGDVTDTNGQYWGYSFYRKKQITQKGNKII